MATGKLLRDSPTPTISETSTFQNTLNSPPPTSSLLSIPSCCSDWDSVDGIDDQQRRLLRRVASKGVLWKHTSSTDSSYVSGAVFRLFHGGDVVADGNCLFTASKVALGTKISPEELRRRTVERFLEDYRSASEEDCRKLDKSIRNLYSPDLGVGWGVHVVQEVKMLARKADREEMEAAIVELVDLGMMRELAAESIYKERCLPVSDGASWAKYMSIRGSPDDENDIISLQYTVDGLLSVDENREGHVAAFGDDIAIESLATEFRREVYVIQAHGSDAVVDEDNCVFFLPHCPRVQIAERPIFLFMKGRGWCGAGGDHYEPMIAVSSPLVSPDKVAMVL